MIEHKKDPKKMIGDKELKFNAVLEDFFPRNENILETYFESEDLSFRSLEDLNDEEKESYISSLEIENMYDAFYNGEIKSEDFIEWWCSEKRSPDMLPFLQKKGIFVEYNPYDGFPKNQYERHILDNAIVLNNKYYVISSVVFDEIFDFIRWHIEEKEKLALERRRDELNYNLTRFLEEKSKVEFLKSEYTKILPQDFDYVLCVEGVEGSGICGVSEFKGRHLSWKDKMIEFFPKKLIWFYLRFEMYSTQWGNTWQSDLYNEIFYDEDCVDDEEPSEFNKYMKKWREFYVTREMVKFILSKIQELESVSNVPGDEQKDNKKPSNYADKKLSDLMSLEAFKSLEDVLKEEKLIDDNFNIIDPGDVVRWSEKKAVCCIGWRIAEIGLLKTKIDDQDYAIVLSNTFNEEVSKSLYSNHRINFDKEKKKYKEKTWKNGKSHILEYYSFTLNYN